MAGRRGRAQRVRALVSIRVSVAILLVFLLVGVGRIVSTYGEFSATADEGAHLGAGMELLDLGRFSYEPKHPPLARVAAAVGPYLASLRSPDTGSMWRDGTTILFSGDSYFETLGLARAGNLVFFVAALVIVWAWARHAFDDGVALASAFCFSLLPVVLAHSGVATTDMAITATLAASVYAVTRWLERPSRARAALFGAALGLMLLSKMTALLFFPLCFVAVLVARFGVGRGGEPAPLWDLRRLLGHGLLAAAVGLVVLWAGFGFSLNPLIPPEWRPHPAIDALVGESGRLHDLVYGLGAVPIYPLTEMVHGIAQATMHGAAGHKGYILGQVFDHGVWYYYPVALFFKTPIPWLLLVFVGLCVTAHLIRAERNWQKAVPLFCALAIMLAMLPSTVNIGLRHVLPVFPFLAIVAGCGAAMLLRSRVGGPAGKAVAVVLLAWTVASSTLAHPNYLAYFNLLAGANPEEILVDSDLDWGQDLERLRHEVVARGIERLAMRVHGPEYLIFKAPKGQNRPFAEIMPLVPNAETTGWVAVSLTRLKLEPEGFEWLAAHEPVARIGSSVLLYNIPGGDGARPPSDAGQDDAS